MLGTAPEFALLDQQGRTVTSESLRGKTLLVDFIYTSCIDECPLLSSAMQTAQEKLRRDGFASMDAGPEGGMLTTRPVKFNGRFMFLNMKTNAPDGEVRVEILHADGRPIEVTDNKTKERKAPFLKEKSIPQAGDQTLIEQQSFHRRFPAREGAREEIRVKRRIERFDAQITKMWVFVEFRNRQQQHEAETARIVVDDATAMIEMQHDMIMRCVFVARMMKNAGRRTIDTKSAAHAQMHADPRTAAEVKAHLLRARFGIDQFRAGERA